MSHILVDWLSITRQNCALGVWSDEVEIQQSKRTDARHPDKTSTVGCLILLVILGILAWVVWNITPDSTKYRIIYQLDSEHVDVENKPADCDWGRAPLGDKGCHYQKQVAPLKNEKGVVIKVYVMWEKVKD
jgi:hypothetical protein